MAYVRPKEVIAPQDRWKLTEVLHNGGEDSWSAAEGRWDEEHCLGVRWNGNRENPLGNPQSSGHSTWFIVPKELEEAVRSALEVMIP